MPVDTIVWTGRAVRIIDQTQLPSRVVYKECRDVPTLWRAIRRLEVRGAPALGIAAAFGVLLGLREFHGTDRARFRRFMDRLCNHLAASRPTAVNLFHALDRMRAFVRNNPRLPVKALKELLSIEAMAIYEEDRLICRAMGAHGARLIKDGMTLMTVCNAGGLATADYGTALGVFYAARKAGRKFKVYALETRPLLQGARLTAWELMRNRIDVTLICDNMAATVMKRRGVDLIVTGADRIAANGDTANKIGTYMLAVLAKHHKVPFYVAAPRSTFDVKIKDGRGIPIEERAADEVTAFAGRSISPEGVKVFNPAFDVTEHGLITGFITEYGIIHKPYGKNILRKGLRSS